MEAKSSTRIEKYFTDIKCILDQLDTEKIEKIVKVLYQTYPNSGTIFIFGNGGSSSTASHFTCDLAKSTIINSWGEEKRLKVICLNDNIPLMTAWANDTEYTNVFIEQLKNLVKKGDVAIGISSSGCSCNVIEAIEYAKIMETYTIGFTGMNGGILKDKVDLAIIVPSNKMQQIEDIHLILCHLISLMMKEIMK